MIVAGVWTGVGFSN